MRSLQDKVAIVTGSTAGIGKAMAKAFAQEGAKVTILSRHLDAVARTRSELEAAGATTLSFCADVSRLADVEQFVEGTVRAWGRIDILVNNAAILPPPGPLAEMSDKEWTDVLAVNLTGVFFTCREVWPHLVAAGGGTIINLVSVIAFKGTANMAAYSATKGGVLSMSRSLAKEGAPLGIRVNCIAPGFIDTPMNEKLLGQWKDPEQWLAETIANIPLARAGHPEEVARAAVFLASDESSYTTGHTLTVDGGAIE
jgi:NAD(P)-dependent dehydrogenase (short-subunit alcohol dehydrogenase family)